MEETLNAKMEKKNLFSLKWDTFIKFLFLLYMCGLTSCNSGKGFQAIFCRLSFAVIVIFEFLYLYNTGLIRNTRISKTFKLYLYFILYYFISMLWGDFDDGMYYVNNFIQIIACAFLLPNHIKNEKDFIDYLKLILISVLVMVVYLYIETPVTVWGTERVGEAVNLNQNTVGLMCATAVMISLYFGQKNKLYYILAVVCSIVSLFSGSRKAFFMVLFGFALFWAFKNRGWKTVINVVIAICGVVILYNLIMNNESIYNVLGYRVEKGINTFLGVSGVTDGSVEERKYYRIYAFEMFKNSPIWGYGANGFVTQISLINYSHVAYSHCNYTELLSTLGLIGFSIYYVPRFVVLKKMIKDFIYSKKLESLLIAVTMFVILVSEYYFVSYIDVYIQIVFIVFFSYYEEILNSN